MIEIYFIRCRKCYEMDIIIFGVGDYFNSRKQTIENRCNIVGYIDNNADVCGMYIEGVQIIKPEDVLTLPCDYIVVMSVFAFEMKQQLIRYGVPQRKIKSYNEFYGQLEKGRLEVWFGRNIDKSAKLPKILIVFNYMRYSSAYTLNLNIIEALIKEGFVVSVATVAGEESCIQEIQEKGVSVLMYGNMHFATQEELFWMKNYDCILVNNVYMVDCVSTISKLRPVIWWIHEPENYIKATINLDEDYDKRKFDMIDICAVSIKARDDYWNCDNSKKIRILPIGIRDEGIGTQKTGEEKIIFAIIGYVGSIKGQDIFVEAISRLSGTEKKRAEFWIIGHIGEVGYGNQIRKMADRESCIKILGEKTKQELSELYKKIDVVVIASRTETLSLVAIEGMMHSKVCIVSDSAGIADYISNGDNGFLYKAENIDELTGRIRAVILNRNCIKDIGMKSRKTYEAFFSLDAFSRSLKDEIEICIHDWDS